MVDERHLRIISLDDTAGRQFHYADLRVGQTQVVSLRGITFLARFIRHHFIIFPSLARVGYLDVG